MRKRLKNIGALLLLVLFAGYWSCVTLFPHVHRIDGLLYVHSHPYSGPAGNPTHSHSAQQSSSSPTSRCWSWPSRRSQPWSAAPKGAPSSSDRSAPHAAPSHRCGAARSGPLPASEPAPAPPPEGSIPPAVPPHPVYTPHYMPCARPVHPGAPFGCIVPMRAPRLRAAPPRRPAVPHPCGACNPPFTTQRNNPT